MKNSLKIAVTGGIGSGKSTVMQILSKNGYNTVSFDEVYSELLSDEKYVLNLSREFEIQPIFQNGKAVLDRKTLSEKVFTNAKLLEKLNVFTHESVFKKAFEKQSDDITFYEVPLLFEGNYQNRFNAVWVVMRDYEKRIKSASERDNCEIQKIELKAKNQVDYEKIDLTLHTVIVNNGNLSQLEEGVKRALSEIKKI